MAMQNDGSSALWVATANGHAEVVGTLLASGAFVIALMAVCSSLVMRLSYHHA